MRVLVTGAHGFIGAHVVGALIEAGHAVVGCSRNPRWARRRCPEAEWVACDFNRDTTPTAWRPRLAGIEAVINCAGLLQGSAGQSIEAIHLDAPLALFEACVAEGIRRVVQISALGIEGETETMWARTKLAADEALMRLDLDWVIVRPSLVYGAGAFGGTSLMRGLAAFPFVVPLPGGGHGQLFQPMAMSDLSRGIARLVERGAPARRVLEAAGPETMTLRQVVTALRAWLGLDAATVLPVPMPLVALGAKLGDLVRWLTGHGTFTTTSVVQMTHGAIGDGAGFAEATGIAPMTMTKALSVEPSHVQDRWHARLYFARPLLRVTLALFWIASGLLIPHAQSWTQAETVLLRVGFDYEALPLAIWAGAIADMVLGALLLVRLWPRLVGAAMLALSAGYLAILSAGAPELWFDPLGPLPKIVPIMAAIVVLMAIEDDR